MTDKGALGQEEIDDLKVRREEEARGVELMQTLAKLTRVCIAVSHVQSGSDLMR